MRWIGLGERVASVLMLLIAGGCFVHDAMRVDRSWAHPVCGITLFVTLAAACFFAGGRIVWNERYYLKDHK